MGVSLVSFFPRREASKRWEPGARTGVKDDLRMGTTYYTIRIPVFDNLTSHSPLNRIRHCHIVFDAITLYSIICCHATPSLMPRHRIRRYTTTAYSTIRYNGVFDNTLRRRIHQYTTTVYSMIRYDSVFDDMLRQRIRRYAMTVYSTISYDGIFDDTLLRRTWQYPLRRHIWWYLRWQIQRYATTAYSTICYDSVFEDTPQPLWRCIRLYATMAYLTIHYDSIFDDTLRRCIRQYLKLGPHNAWYIFVVCHMWMCQKDTICFDVSIYLPIGEPDVTYEQLTHLFKLDTFFHTHDAWIMTHDALQIRTTHRVDLALDGVLDDTLRQHIWWYVTYNGLFDTMLCSCSTIQCRIWQCYIVVTKHSRNTTSCLTLQRNTSHNNEILDTITIVFDGRASYSTMRWNIRRYIVTSYLKLRCIPRSNIVSTQCYDEVFDAAIDIFFDATRSRTMLQNRSMRRNHTTMSNLVFPYHV